MGALLATYEPCSDKDVLPYAAADINTVMIDFMMGQLPEQDMYESSGGLYSIDIFLQIFGEPQTKKEFGDNYLFYYPLKDSKNMIISVDAFAYDISSRVQINGYDAY